MNILYPYGYVECNMRILPQSLLLFVVLFSCGPAQDSSPRTEEERVAEAEALYTGAYENLDAAVMERLLTEDYEVVYTEPDNRKDKRQWIGELGQLRALFPQLTISVDSSRIIPYRDNYMVQGIRTFHWTNDGQDGSYQERFANRWRMDGGNWRLYGTRISPGS